MEHASRDRECVEKDEPHMKILGLQELRFGVSDIETPRLFLRDWNLEPIAGSNSEIRYTTLDAAEIRLLPEDSQLLPPAVNSECKLREIIWAVDSQAELDKIAAELSSDRRLIQSADGTIHAVDDSGLGVAFALSALRPLAPAQPLVNFPGQPRRKNTPVDFTQRPQVRHLGHVAIFVPDLQKAQDFYEKRLGFRASDLYPGRGVFLRAAGSHDHHNLFLLQRPKGLGFHHMSFEVADFHEVMMGGRYMQKEGWKSHFGPGRHTLGSNYFWYFALPFEGSCEYYSDMDYLDDDWETRSWDYSPDIVAAWTAEVAATANQ